MTCPLCHSFHSEFLPVTADGRTYHKCGICDFVWLDPAERVSTLEEKNRYLEHNNHTGIPAYLAYLQRLAIPLFRHARAGGRGLDYGCGPVEGMKAVVEPLGFSVQSYDPLFFPEEKLLEDIYDFVLLCEVAEHFHEPRAEFEKIHGLLHSGGVLGVSSWFMPPLPEFSGWSYRRDKTHVGFFGEKNVRLLAEEIGFEVLEIEPPRWILRKI